jgi:HEAT repeat protein
LVRIVAAQSLAGVGHGEEALPVLVEALKDSHPETGNRRRALWSLDLMGSRADGAIPALLQVVKEGPLDDNGSRFLRVWAASILIHLGTVRETLPILRGALRDEDEWVRQSARLALERYEREGNQQGEQE